MEDININDLNITNASLLPSVNIEPVTTSPSTTTIPTTTTTTLSSITSTIASTIVSHTIKTVTRLSVTKPKVVSVTTPPPTPPSITLHATITEKAVTADEEIDLASSFSTASISTLLLGLDYIFYLWTFLLISIVTYLSIYKYLQYRTSLKKQAIPAPITKQPQANTFLKKISLYLTRVFNFLRNLKNVHSVKSVPPLSGYISGQRSALDGIILSNCLKWFYSNHETVKLINQAILNSLKITSLGTSGSPPVTPTNPVQNSNKPVRLYIITLSLKSIKCFEFIYI